MKHARTGFATCYLNALRSHLQMQHPANGDRAQGLGRTALTNGLMTRDLALIHEQAMTALTSAHDFGHSRKSSRKRASVFFTQTLIPLETAQRDTREINRLLRERNETLRAHTAALARGNRRLESEIARRKTGEQALSQSKERYQQLFRESLLMQRKLRHLTRQIILAQEEERKEISRELHDEVLQTLVGINVQLSALSKGTSLSLHALKTKIARTQRLVENSVSTVHRFARELRPTVLDDLGLIPALHAYSKSMACREKIKIKLTAFSGVEALGSAKRTMLFRVAQEALTNVARHAHATEARISISKISGAIRMEISDNGTSFDVGKTLLAKNPKRLGLLGMKERIEMIGGGLKIESTPRIGTTVRAEIPFHHKKAKS